MSTHRFSVHHFSILLLCASAVLHPLIAQEADSLLRLTPRPSAVADVSVPLMSLNGIWLFRPEFSAADTAVGESAGWFPISVPAEWVMQSYTVTPGTYATYKRTFEMPADWTGKRIKLRFDGVHSCCRIWVNGSRIGEHEGGFAVFEFDITNQVKPGGNDITVAVKNESIADTLASASQYAAHQLGGITRKVTLFVLPELSIASLVTIANLDRQFKHADLTMDMEVLMDSAGSASTPEVTFTLTDPSGREVPISPATVTLGSLAPTKSIQRSVSLHVANVKTWDPEHPHLYTLRTFLKEEGRTLETVEQRVGFREIAVRGNRVFVNGRPIKLHGVNRHEVHPVLGRSLTPELWRKDAEVFREANVNYVRTSHYPPAEEFLDACDELGIFVECEAAICWVQHPANEKWNEWDYRDRRFFPYLLRANLESIAAHRHHPSIIIWSLANESYWSPSFARVLDAVRRADPSRLTSFHDQCWGEFNNGGSRAQVAVYHYPDEKSPERCNGESRPVLFGEYTHVECYNRSETVTDPGIRDDWGRPFERMYDLVYRNPGCLGGAIWAGIDEVFSLPGGHGTGYGPWGIVDGWRRHKPEYWHVKKSYSPVKVVDRNRPLAAARGIIRVRLENRYDFTNLNEVAITWTLGNERGTASVDVKPHRKGVLNIRPKRRPVTGERLTLVFTDPRGFVCETEEFAIGAVERIAERKGSHPAVGSLDSTATSYFVRGQQFVCEVDRKTGKILYVESDRGSLLVGGPELMILPLYPQSDSAGPNYRADFPPLNNTCTDWRQKSIYAALTEDGAAHIVSEGTYAEAEGSSTLTLRGDGEIVVTYSFRALQEVNPRQWGMVFYAPRDLDSLSWQRVGQWHVYPPDHIGRPSGSAIAHPRPRGDASLGRIPGGEWPEDANELGTNDFRSTKREVTWASLLATDGYGISLPDLRLSALRAFVDDRRIGLLIAGFNSGGADHFYAMHYAAERKPLKKGDMIAGKFTMRLIQP